MRLRFDVTGEDLLADGSPLNFEALGELFGSFMGATELGACEEVSVSLSFVDDAKIRALNARYRNIDEPTDVLSFPLWEDDGVFHPPEDWMDLPLGDVIVAPLYVHENAKNQKVDYNDEITRMVVHGVLHLIGYDHDTEGRKNLMWGEQEVLVGKYLRKIRGGLMSE